MNRRDFLNRLGFTIAALPFAGLLLKPKQPRAITPLPDSQWGTGWEPGKIAKWDTSAWEELSESLDNPNFYHYHLKNSGIVGSPFKSVIKDEWGKYACISRDSKSH